jgi:tetratricopeptide (TPR) repeat protein
MVLRVAPGFDPLKAKIGPDEYFLLSRVDGRQSVREVLLATGLPIDRAIAIVKKLRALGALLVPSEGAVPPPPSAVVDVATERLPRNLVATGIDAPTMRKAGKVELPAREVPALPDPTPEEVAALTEESELTDADRHRILAMERLVIARDPWALLGVPRGSDAKTLKRAYFTLSKSIHPDRYFGRQLGSFAQRLVLVFEATSRAYAKLTSTDPRTTGPHPPVGGGGDAPQTPQEYAAELFDRACTLELAGESLEAMKLFAAAVRVDPQPRYLRRAASCGIAAEQPKSAVEYAKKAQSIAPDDPSAARLLASAFRAAGKLADAEEVLVMAMAMRNSSDSLTAELRNDLAEVRRQLSADAR